MATYKHAAGKRLHFIHIPRTGGRFIDKNLLVNGFKQEHSTQGTIEGSDIIHLHRELYEKHLDVKGIPHIAIIRNPIDRFISSSIFLKRMYGDIQEAMEDPIMFSTMIQNFPLPDEYTTPSWLRPQSDFLTEDTHVWKFEDGFYDDFDVWMSNILEIPFKTRNIEYKKLETDETDKLERTDKLVANIQQFCKKDIETFYPELI
tara:strand:- start:196 stop:804 length:609 start_codon:yes stop_codon:yes gene_type:complete